METPKKITITRSFSRTKQVQQFEPINSFCSASFEFEMGEGDAEVSIDRIKAHSEALDEIVRSEVERTITGYVNARIPACTDCGGKRIAGNVAGNGIDKDGRCAACAADYAGKVRGFAKSKKFDDGAMFSAEADAGEIN
ncbi:MAG: hypothetical protein KGL39_14905 [Patescibacteria group bacterium]|nr:hypothetical protein [Patescibacteria group bacterium]